MFWIIAIEQNDNGSHNNQTWPNRDSIPEGYAVFSEELEPANELENFPFGNVEIEEIEGIKTVVKWSPLPIPEVPEEPDYNPIEELKSDMISVIDNT